MKGPEGTNLDKNTSDAKNNKGNLKWFKNQVKTGGPWDYKTNGSQFENFGNWHYGLVGRASGIPGWLLKASAGAYQVYSGTSRLGFFGSYFDDPRDQHWIQHGIDYYDANY